MKTPAQWDFQCIPVNKVWINWNTPKNSQKVKKGQNTHWLSSSSWLQSWWEWQMLMQGSTGTCANCFEFFFFFLAVQPPLFTSTLQICERATQPWTVHSAVAPGDLFFKFLPIFLRAREDDHNAESLPEMSGAIQTKRAHVWSGKDWFFKDSRR